MATISCPTCQDNRVRRSPRRSLRDLLLACFCFAPFRCRSCRHRFYRLWLPRGIDHSPLLAPAKEQQAPQRLESVLANIQQPLRPAQPSVLIVDHDTPVRKLLRRILERHGYRTFELTDASNLASELQVRRVDLLITDLDLDPDQEAAAVSAIGKTFPELKLVVLASEPFKNKFVAPRLQVLPKPVHTDALLVSVHRALGKA